MSGDYTVVDLETTGLNPKTDRIIEIGAVKVRNGVLTEAFETLVNPGRKLQDQIAELTGIRNEELETAPDIEQVIPLLLDFIGTDILVGHRILFDYSFIKKAAVNQNLTFEKEAIDTLALAKKFLPHLESRRLPFLCQYFGIPHQAHRALQDAEATAALYAKLKDLYGNEKDFTPRRLIYQVKKETPATKPQKERLYKLYHQHKLILDINVEKLTRNEASRITDKILSTYGR